MTLAEFFENLQDIGTRVSFLEGTRHHGRTARVIAWATNGDGYDGEGPLLRFEDGDHEERWYPGQSMVVLVVIEPKQG